MKARHKSGKRVRSTEEEYRKWREFVNDKGARLWSLSSWYSVEDIRGLPEDTKRVVLAKVRNVGPKTITCILKSFAREAQRKSMEPISCECGGTIVCLRNDEVEARIECGKCKSAAFSELSIESAIYRLGVYTGSKREREKATPKACRFCSSVILATLGEQQVCCPCGASGPRRDTPDKAVKDWNVMNEQ